MLVTSPGFSVGCGEGHGQSLGYGISTSFGITPP